MSGTTKFTVSQLSSSNGPLTLRGGSTSGLYDNTLVLSGAIRLEKLAGTFTDKDSPALYVSSTGKLSFKADESSAAKAISDAATFGTNPSAGLQLLTSDGTSGAIQGNAGMQFQIADGDALFTLTSDSRFEFSKDSGSKVMLDMGDIGGVDKINIGLSAIPVNVIGDLSVGDDLTIAGDTDIAGNLTVRGTTTIINTTNLSVKDQMVVIGSGTLGQNNPGAIIISSGSNVNANAANNDLFIGRVGADIWGVGKASTLGGGAATSVLAAGVPVGFQADSLRLKAGASGAVLIVSGAAGSTGDRLNLATAGTVPAAGHSLTLGGNLTVTANSEDVTLVAEDNASTITLDNSTLEIENTNATSRLMKLVVGTDADATLKVEGTSGVINQDVSSDASPSFTGVTLSGATASKLVGTNGSKALSSVNLDDFVAGTTNQITVTDDTDGTITLSTPQNLDSGADVVFGTAKLADTGMVTSTGGVPTLQLSGTLDVSGMTGGKTIRVHSGSQHAFEIYNITNTAMGALEKKAFVLDSREHWGGPGANLQQHRHAMLTAAKRGLEIHLSGTQGAVPSLVSILANYKDVGVQPGGFNPMNSADVSFYVSGSKFNRKVGTEAAFQRHAAPGVSVFEGDIVLSGAMTFQKALEFGSAGLTAAVQGVESDDAAFFYAKSDAAGKTAIWVHSSSGGSRADFPLLPAGSGGGGGGTMSNFTLAGDGGSSQTITQGETLTVAGGNGITTTAGNTDTVTVAVDSSLTTVTTIQNGTLSLGADANNQIDFGEAGSIDFKVGGVDAMILELESSKPAFGVGTTGGTTAVDLVATFGLGDDTTAEMAHVSTRVRHGRTVDISSAGLKTTGYTVDFSKFAGCKVDVTVAAGSNERLIVSLMSTAKENVSAAADIVNTEMRAATSSTIDNALQLEWSLSGTVATLNIRTTTSYSDGSSSSVTVRGTSFADDFAT